MKRKLSMVLSLSMAAASLAGMSTVSFAEEAKEFEGQTLKVAAIETAYGTEMWTEVCAAFEEMTGATVELITDKNLEDVIGNSFRSGDYPDVVHLATGRPAAMTETMIKDEALTDLTAVLDMTVPGEDVTVKEKIAGGFTDSSLTNPYGDGKTYLAPMFYSPCGLFYNAGLFEEKGWEVPETWDEMWALGDTAAEEGIALFSYPTTGYFDAFFYAMLYEAGGPEFFDKATHYEEGIWDTEEAKLVFDTITKLASYTEKSVPSNANNDNYLKNQQLVCDNKALFMPNGNWVIGEMKDAPKAEGFDWGFMALPALTEGGDRYSFAWFEQIWVPAAAPNVDLAKEFIAYMYSDEAAAIFAESGAIQPLLGLADTLEGDNKTYYSIYDNGAKVALGGFATTDAVEGVNIADTVFGTINSLVSGDKTEEEWIEAIKADSDKLREALK